MAADRQYLLQLRDYSLTRRTPGGPQTILSNIDLDISQGRWLAVLGSNGSGKSSLLKYLASDDSPLRDSRAIMFQDPDEQIIAQTVERELSLGRPDLAVAPLLDEFSLGGLDQLDPRLLSAGQKQRLVLAVALAGQPEVLFCDEPTALQDSEQTGWLLDHLDRWRQEPGRTLITATCDPREVALADELVVLDDGKIVRGGPRPDLWDDPLVRQLLGRDQVECVVESQTETAATVFDQPPVLELVELGLRFVGSMEPLNVQLHAGQRLGITGANGSGKSTLLAACVGALKPETGQVFLSGQKLYAKGHRGLDRDLDHGLALLAPQFPEYLFTRATVVEEWALDPALAGLDLPEYLTRLGLPADLAGRDPHSLSSGQKRRLALGLVLFSARPLILLDEPTAALDTTGRGHLLEMLDQLPRTAALVIASHDERFLQRAGCTILQLG